MSEIPICNHCHYSGSGTFMALSVQLSPGASWSRDVYLCWSCVGQAFQALLDRLDEAERVAWLAMWGKRKGEKP